jgi:hypothetical protein
MVVIVAVFMYLRCFCFDDAFDTYDNDDICYDVNGFVDNAARNVVVVVVIVINILRAVMVRMI